MRNRRATGVLGIVLVAGYLVLRLGSLALREEHDGASPTTIVLSLVGTAAGAFVLVEIILWCYHLHSRARERALAGSHPDALRVPILFKRDLVRELTVTGQMLGLATPKVPRSGYGTLVADRNGIGIFAGGGQPYLVLGLARSSVQSVGDGETSGAGRYSMGTVQSMRIVAATPEHFSAIDLPVYRTVLGFPKTVRNAQLDDVVRRVASAAGVSLAQPPLDPRR